MKQVFDIASFKNFILADSDRFRIDGLSIWYNSIPIPVDLFDVFFDSWPDLFRNYIDHLMAALILNEILSSDQDCNFSVSDFPDPELVEKHKSDLYRKMTEIIGRQKVFREISVELADILGIEHYNIDVISLLLSASIKGKKYKRLYVPRPFRSAIISKIPHAFDEIALSNGDMFGNILADKLKLYRSGFSDALSGLFNKLLDYKVTQCSGHIKFKNSALLNFGNSKDGAVFSEEKTSDGSLWEPFFDGELKVKLNPVHPHFSSISESSNPEAALKIISIMSQIEMNSANEKELRLIEDIRTRISRDLWT